MPKNYRELEELIRSELEKLKEKYHGSTTNISMPEFDYSSGVEISFELSPEIKRYQRIEAILTIIRIARKYYASKFSATSYDSKLDFVFIKGGQPLFLSEKKEKRWKEENEIEVRYCFTMYHTIGPSLSFRKNQIPSQHDINFILELIENITFLEGAQENKFLKPQEKLEEWGVVIYKPEALNFDCLGGYQRVKEQVLDSVILPFLHHEIYEKIAKKTRKVKSNSPIPKAVLFEGPPGTGKTMMARIVGSRCSVPLVYVPFESFLTCWYGESEKKLAAIFDAAAQMNGCILFLDEIDAIAPSRSYSIHEGSRRVLSTLLRKIQGFVEYKKTLLIGATNRKDDLDSALLNRFDKVIYFHLPNELERVEIFSIYAKHLDKEVLQKLGAQTDNFSGRDIENVCEDAERRFVLDLIKKRASGKLPSENYYFEAVEQRRKALGLEPKHRIGFTQND